MIISRAIIILIVLSIIIIIITSIIGVIVTFYDYNRYSYCCECCSPARAQGEARTYAASRLGLAKKIVYTSRFVRVILAQGPC